MFGMGMPEILLILAIGLIVIGPKKLPELAKSLGRAMNEFKRATNEFKDTLELDTDVKKTFDDIDAELKKPIDISPKDTDESSDKNALKEKTESVKKEPAKNDIVIDQEQENKDEPVKNDLPDTDIPPELLFENDDNESDMVKKKNQGDDKA